MHKKSAMSKLFRLIMTDFSAFCHSKVPRKLMLRFYHCGAHPFGDAFLLYIDCFKAPVLHFAERPGLPGVGRLDKNLRSLHFSVSVVWYIIIYRR